jgi:hypothetical protein
MDDRVLVNVLQNGVKIILQSKEIDQKRFLYSFVVKEVVLLMEREDSIGRLDEISIPDLGPSEKLATFEALFERKRADPQFSAHSWLAFN